MQIHNNSGTEGLAATAKKCGVDEGYIRNVNQMHDQSPAPGEEILVPIPTRTHTAAHGDTVERMALRFGLRKADIIQLNPWLANKAPAQGEAVALKSAERPYGMSVGNGYFYKGCTEEMLNQALPYITYVTFASAVADKSGITEIFNDRAAKKKCDEESKISLIRIFDRYPERYKKETDLAPFAEQLITHALAGEYKGIVLDACALNNSADEFVAFLMILRKMMIGCDLILITEVSEESPIEFSEYSDGSILFYPKYSLSEAPSFEEGERRVLSDFACRGESAKTFVDLPSLAIMGNEFTPISEALNIARKGGYEITHNESTLLSHFYDRKQGEYRFTSLKNLREIFNLVNEYNYMGISFDIMRTPLSHLMMYNSLFKTHFHTNVRAVEGCNRAGED